mgnify:CR=1 FL=1
MIFWSSFPFVRLVIPFAVGILFSSFFDFSTSFVFALIFGASFLLFLLFHFFNKSYTLNYWGGVFATVFYCLLGVIYTNYFNKIEQLGIESVPEQTAWLGEVESVKYKNDKIQSLVVQIERYEKDSSWVESNFKLIVYNKDSLLEAKVGDFLSAKGKLQRTSGPQNPTQFDYRKFLKHKNIFLTTFEDQFVKVNSSNSLMRYAETARASIIEIYKSKGIEAQNLAVLIALTLGDKSFLDFELQNQYAGAGAMHILAVSGLHVGIVFLIFSFLLSKLPERLAYRILRAVVLLFVIWAFAFLAGLSPSVQRAGWMFSFVILSKLVKRNSNIVNSIAVSAFLLLLLDPNNLFQVGFQLSYSAVIGIVLMHPPIYKLLYSKYWLVDKAWSLLVVSLVAQIATLPFTLAYFHQFPNYFLLANLFVIPLAFGIVSGSVVIVSLNLLVGTDFYISKIVDFFLTVLNEIIAIITALPGAISEGVWLHPISIAFLICCIVTFNIVLYYRNVKVLFAFLTLIIAIQAVELVDTYRQLNSRQITFYALSNPTWSFVHGQQAEVYCSEGGREYDQKMVKDHLQSLGVEQISWNTVKSTPNQVLNLAEEIILFFPEQHVLEHAGSSVDYVVQSKYAEPVFSDAVVLDYFYRYSQQFDSLDTNQNYFNLRKNKAYLKVF